MYILLNSFLSKIRFSDKTKWIVLRDVRTCESDILHPAVGRFYLRPDQLPIRRAMSIILILQMWIVTD